MKQSDFLQIKNRFGIETKTLVLFGILIVLLLAVAGSFIFSRTKKEQSFESVLVLEKDIPAIQKIIISIPAKNNQPGVEYGFEKKDGRWFLSVGNQMFQAKELMLNRLLETLSAKRYFTPITKNAAHYANYGLEDSHAAGIRLIKDGDAILADIYFGNINTLGTDRYVRTGKTTDVLLTADSFHSFLQTYTDLWLNLQIYQDLFTTQRIQSLQFGHSSGNRNRNEEAFKALEKFLQSFSCLDIYTEPIPSQEKTETILLHFEQSEPLAISVTPLPNGDRVLTDSISGHTYLISDYTAKRLTALVQKCL
ncbi:DUF4340 domain-containing protein [Treponema phagedenis]|uniref:DUF4340 domain-containing protein n=1 Tax=Treponema phagedenis TaxID=162 RepID=UPI0001F642F9|nr:DUF4340 domain-containing protein [Treponema phagedenis]EFW38897.1 hypothetical protein HMPREF9554_00616 [Treponema phagedenis F0421]TYT78764.1 DUF4340 domain-containing protein [Treponema phagedenis]